MTPYTFAHFVHAMGALLLFMAIAIDWVCLHRLRRAESIDQAREWESH